MCTSFRRAFALSALVGAAALPAAAQERERFFIRGGPAYANFDASAHVSVSGVDVPGGDASVRSNTGAVFETGYLLSTNWEMTFAFGVPPKARIFGSGTLSSAGKLGEANYAPAVLGLLCVPWSDGALRPYIGGGINYTLIYNVRDSALSQLKVDNAFGAVLQFGTEYRLGPKVAWFFDIKKIWLSTKASGTVASPGGPLAASARVTLDPVILSTGLSFHF